MREFRHLVVVVSAPKKVIGDRPQSSLHSSVSRFAGEHLGSDRAAKKGPERGSLKRPERILRIEMGQSHYSVIHPAAVSINCGESP